MAGSDAAGVDLIDRLTQRQETRDAHHVEGGRHRDRRRQPVLEHLQAGTEAPRRGHADTIATFCGMP
jgi:hypothetical protein